MVRVRGLQVNGENRMGGEKNKRRVRRSDREGDKFECGFELINRGREIMEMGKGVVKIFLIFERELYTFVIIRIM